MTPGEFHEGVKQLSWFGTKVVFPFHSRIWGGVLCVCVLFFFAFINAGLPNTLKNNFQFHYAAAQYHAVT